MKINLFSLIIIGVIIIGAIFGVILYNFGNKNYINSNEVKQDYMEDNGITEVVLDIDSVEVEGGSKENDEYSGVVQGIYNPLMYGAGDDPHYKFEGNIVTLEGNAFDKGIFDVKNYIIKNHFTKSMDPEGNVTEEKYDEELIKVDENTLVSTMKLENEIYTEIYLKTEGKSVYDYYKDNKSIDNITGKWNTYRIINRETGEEENFMNVFGSSYREYGSYIEIKEDNTFLDCTSPIQSSESPVGTDYSLTKNSESDDNKYLGVELNYSDKSSIDTHIVYLSNDDEPTLIYPYGEQYLLLLRK